MITDDSEMNPDVAAAAESAMSDPREEAVLVFDAASHDEAQIVKATLESAGIPAFLNRPAQDPYFGAKEDPIENVTSNGVYVAPSNLEAARAVLNTPMTEAELVAAEEADPTTLAEAERQVKHI
jgi:hypothetical protein